MDPSRLLIIERSKNASIVVYHANMDAYGNLREKSPVRIRWYSWGWTEVPFLSSPRYASPRYASPRLSSPSTYFATHTPAPRSPRSLSPACSKERW